MANRFKSAGTIHRKAPAVIPCQYGLIYTVTPNALGTLLAIRNRSCGSCVESRA